MKSYLFLILTFSTFMVVACGDDDPEGVGQSRNVSSYDLKPGIDSKPLPGLPETDCVTLPGISVVGFYLVGGGGFGAMYAVNYPSQPYLVSSVQGFTSGTGCSNTAKTDRIAYVQSDFQTLRNHAQALISAGALANPGG